MTEVETKALEAAKITARLAYHELVDYALFDATVERAIRAYLAALDSPIGEQGVGVDPTELHQIGMTLNFLACVIKSGEAWTGTCQREFNAAHACLSQVRSAISPERKEPVAWARRFEGRWLYTRITRVAEIWREQGCEVQPLYATPEQPT